jgi:hypothetical protein
VRVASNQPSVVQAAPAVDAPGAPTQAAPPVDLTAVLDEPATRAYLDETVRTWLGLSDRKVEVPALPQRLARLLLRLEEYEQDGRDRWGCWDVAYSANFQSGHVRLPEVDTWLAARRAELEQVTTLEPTWPNGHRFAVCLTHDVDLLSPRSTARQALRYARAGSAAESAAGREPRSRLARPPVRRGRACRHGIVRTPSMRDTLERSVDVETRRGAVASYFFTVPPTGHWTRFDCVYAPGDPCRFRGARLRLTDVVHVLADEGFDVGLHGGYRAALEPGALEAERNALVAASGLAITTTRQHFLRWDIRTTPLLQESAGLRADSSLGFNRGVGFRAGTSLPFRHFDVPTRRTLGLLEVPLVIQDGALLRPDGLALDLERAQAVVRELIDAVAEVGGAMTLLFHPDKFVRPDWLALYESTLDYALERQGWLTSLGRLEEWWGAREVRVRGS